MGERCRATRYVFMKLSWGGKQANIKTQIIDPCGEGIGTSQFCLFELCYEKPHLLE